MHVVSSPVLSCPEYTVHFVGCTCTLCLLLVYSQTHSQHQIVQIKLSHASNYENFFSLFMMVKVKYINLDLVCIQVNYGGLTVPN